jgi:DNA-binding transcriptional regulator YiaG
MSATLLKLPLPDREVAEREYVDVAAVRRSLKLSRDRMALAFGIPRNDLAQMELGNVKPRGLAKVLLVVASRDPSAVRGALESMGLA